MGDTTQCDVCGNELDVALSICPFCDQPREPEFAKQGKMMFRVVNLERGMPFVQDAVKRLKTELDTASSRGFRVLVLIHGYGSSGKGGAIRDAVRKELKLHQERRRLRDILPGEKSGTQSRQARHLLKRFPMLEEYLRHPNPGITMVVV